MTCAKRLRISVLFLLLVYVYDAQGFVPRLGRPTKNIFTSTTTSLDAYDEHDGPFEHLNLSSSDMARFAALRERFKVIPILIMDSMLPGQKLDFGRYED